MAVSVLSSLSTGQSLIAGLAGGYVVTQSGSGSPSATLNLRPVDALSTVASTGTVTGEFIDESCCNNAGDAYLLTNASSTTRTLRSITQTGGAISVTSVGTFTVPTSGGNLDDSFLDPANTQVLVQYSGIGDFSAVNTGTGALDWTSTHSGHSLTALACMGDDRYLAACSTHSDIELWNGSSDTLLDSIARDSARSATEVLVPITATSAFYVIQVASTSPDDLRIGLLSTSGDAFAWTWGTTDYTTGWSGTSPADPGANAAAWGSTVSIGPANRLYAGSYQIKSLYLVDTATQVVTASDADASVGYGVYPDEMWWAGADAFAVHDYYFYSDITSWSVPVTPPDPVYRRPFGTSYHLRQRQTPYIT